MIERLSGSPDVIGCPKPVYQFLHWGLDAEKGYSGGQTHDLVAGIFKLPPQCFCNILIEHRFFQYNLKLLVPNAIAA
jgi:hypothetical protein